MKLLIVEDEKDTASALNCGLTRNGYTVDIAKNGDEALHLTEVNHYDLMVLDLNLPDIDGIEICRIVHEQQPALLILILTAREKQQDIVAGLDNGADDYLIKPYHLQEILARIRALLRRDMRARDLILKIQDISFDSVEKVVWKASEKIPLTRKEFGIVEYLMRRANQVISQEELLEHVWGSSTNPFSNTIRVHIQSIREKLKDDPKNPIYIKTVAGVGYCFINPDRMLEKNVDQKEAANG